MGEEKRDKSWADIVKELESDFMEVDGNPDYKVEPYPAETGLASPTHIPDTDTEETTKETAVTK